MAKKEKLVTREEAALIFGIPEHMISEPLNISEADKENIQFASDMARAFIDSIGQHEDVSNAVTFDYSIKGKLPAHLQGVELFDIKKHADWMTGGADKRSSAKAKPKEVKQNVKDQS